MIQLRPRHLKQQGFTLIELSLVIVIIALISSLVVSRFDSIVFWRIKGDMRKFVNTWQFLFQESLGRGESYRLVIDLDANTYFVRREVPVGDRTFVQVDRLKNLRLKSEQARRDQQELNNLPSLDEEYREQDYRESGSLETLFYDYVFADPEGNVRLAMPLEFPSLAEQAELTKGLRFLDVRAHGERQDRGQVFIRFSPRGASEFAVVHLRALDDIFTVVMNPSSGEVSVHKGYADFEWSLGNEQG